MSHTELAFAQARFKPAAAFHRAPQSRWLEPQRRLARQHAAELLNSALCPLPAAHGISAGPNSAPLAATRTNDIVEMQTQRPYPSTHVGHPNHDQLPPLGNLLKWMLMFCSTWPSWTRNVVVAGVTMPTPAGDISTKPVDHRGKARRTRYFRRCRGRKPDRATSLSFAGVVWRGRRDSEAPSTRLGLRRGAGGSEVLSTF